MTDFIKLYLKIFGILSATALGIFLLFWGLTALFGADSGLIVTMVILIISFLSLIFTITFS